MATDSFEPVDLSDKDDRHSRMHSAVSDWMTDLAASVDDARTTSEFQKWLTTQARFTSYSPRNRLLIYRQFPDARHVAGYRTWQTEFDRQVESGENAIWIWAPVRVRTCPDCDRGVSDHPDDQCSGAETPPDEWDYGVVGFCPTPVFDVTQTTGEALPTLDHEARGDPGTFVQRALDAAAGLGLDAHLVPADEWPYGDAGGRCSFPGRDKPPQIEVCQRGTSANQAKVVVHEFAHGLLHAPDSSRPERSKREVEAEAVAYAVGRELGLDVDGSALYLAAWDEDAADTIQTRVNRISSTTATLLSAVAPEAGETRD